MTTEEKRKVLREYCRKTGDTAQLCVLKEKDWQHKCASCMGYDCDCLYISAASEEELDMALELIEKSGCVLPVREAEGIKSAEMVLLLEVGDGSAMRVAHAICKESVQTMGGKENALIYLDELTEHIDAYVRAERKALEYKKMAEED